MGAVYHIKPNEKKKKKTVAIILISGSRLLPSSKHRVTDCIKVAAMNPARKEEEENHGKTKSPR